MFDGVTCLCTELCSKMQEIDGALEGGCEVTILLARSWRGHEKKRGQRPAREVTILLARSWRGHENKRGQRSAQRNRARSCEVIKFSNTYCEVTKTVVKVRYFKIRLL